MAILRTFIRRKVKETISKYKSKPTNVLEIGCGTRPHINKSVKIDKIWNNDITKGTYHKNNCFDMVIMEEVIEHIDYSKQEYVISEIKRVLKPNGTFIFSTPNKHLYHIWLTGRYKESLKKEHIGELTYSELKTLLRKHFDNVTIKPSRFSPALWGSCIKEET